MVFGMFLMLVLVASGEGVVAWLVWRKMAAYLSGNEEAVAALTRHLFVPLLGKDVKPEAKPEAKKAKGTLL